MGIIMLIILGLGALFIVVCISLYNKLIALRNQYKNAYSQIDVQLKRRYDLIPNLIETAKGYIKHERETLEGVIAARNQAAFANDRAAKNPGDPSAMKSLLGAEAALSGTLSRLFAVAENYPDLKANQTMSLLMTELSTTENKISESREGYNDAVMMYNTQREVFPSVIIASMFNFGPAELFELTNAQEREAPKVSF